MKCRDTAVPCPYRERTIWPVLDGSGKLVGINGKSKYPLGGIDVFKLADGSVLSQVVFRKMEALSWAIPIDTFQQLVSHLKA